MIKRLIFDVDGTLITGIDFFPYIKAALGNYGIYDLSKTKQFLLNIKEYEKTYNRYDRNLYLEFFSDKLGISLDYHFLEILFNQLKKAIPENSANIKKVLSSLANYELVLLSNYFEESQRNRLTAMGINNYFSNYYGEQSVKPNELSYKMAQGKHSPSECVIIGDDKELDINIPSSLGFNTIYVNRNGNIKSIEDLSKELIEEL